MDYYGIRGSTYKWINQRLFRRTQQIVLDIQASDPVPVLSSVPKGSVLGPFLLLSFINDMQDHIRSSVRLFAGDCVLYRNIYSIQDCLICLFDLVLYVPSTIFQFNKDGSSWVEPVLSQDECVLLKDHKAVTPVWLKPATPQSRGKHSTTEPLRSHRTVLSCRKFNVAKSHPMRVSITNILSLIFHYATKI